MRPVACCGKCPPIVGGGYDCTCEGNPRCGRRGRRRPLRCRLGWHAYHYRIAYDNGPTYDECARCGDRKLIALGGQR